MYSINGMEMKYINQGNAPFIYFSILIIEDSFSCNGCLILCF